MDVSKATNSSSATQPPTSSNLMSSLVENKQTASAQSKNSKKTNKLPNEYDVFKIKNKLVIDLTHAIQLVQKHFLDKDDCTKQMTNSDFQVHHLCQQFDLLFLFGLKRPEDAYWNLIKEFTHKDFIQELSRLLNVTTSFGKSRAWLYHALNENLMESYLRYIFDDKKLVSQFYLKDCSIIADQQVLSVLITLVAGLENVVFKLFNDVPYLDHSCWPTHFNAKRIYVDSFLNSTAPLDLATLSTQSKNTLEITNKKSTRSNTITSTPATNNTNMDSDTDAKPQLVVRRKRRNSNRRVNNVTLDENLQTHNFKTKFNSDKANTKLQQQKKFSDEDEPDDQKLDESESVHEDGHESEDDSDNIYSDSSKRNEQAQIDKEINKLRRQTLIISNKKIKEKKAKELQVINSSSTSSFLSNGNAINNQDLLASSLKATDQFDKKIEDLEKFSQIIEQSTRNMEMVFRDMDNVYNGFKDHYNSSNNDEETTPVANLNDVINKFEQTNLIETESSMKELSYRSEKKEEKENLEEHNSSIEILKDESIPSDIDLYNNNETVNTTNNEDNLTSTSENLTNDSSNTSHIIIDSENNYLVNSKFDIRQEIKVDTNLKLVLMINIFQNGENEQLYKLYSLSRGHNQGEIEKIYLLITSHGIYVLVRNDTNDLDDTKSSINNNNLLRRKSVISNNNECYFKKESYVSHAQVDYVEVGLEGQTIHMACMNKRQSFWITTACRLLTENYLQTIQEARGSSFSRLLPLSVFHEATQQRLALSKFIANEEKLTTQDIKINKYQLIYWEDQNSSTNYLIHKEGMLSFFNKSPSSSNLEWKTGYFVLKNDVLTQFKNTHDKRPSQIIKLNGEDFLNCRKNNNTSRPNTIELIFSNGNIFYLSAKSETDAIDWLQIFCRVISLGNINTDVPAYSCVPCCTVITINKIYFCHEDLTTGFYRLLEAVKLQEINRISFDNDYPFYCILHDDIDSKKGKYWFVYFVDENERNHFITGFKEAWELLFQVPFTIERCKSSELRNRCIRSINLIHNEFDRD